MSQLLFYTYQNNLILIIWLIVNYFRCYNCLNLTLKVTIIKVINTKHVDCDIIVIDNVSVYYRLRYQTV